MVISLEVLDIKRCVVCPEIVWIESHFTYGTTSSNSNPRARYDCLIVKPNNTI